VGGKDNEQPVPVTTGTVVVGNLGSSTRFHVSPTLTLANRAREPSYTGVNILDFRRSHHHKRHRRGAPQLQ